MERTQIYLTEREHQRLQQLSRGLGKSQSELIRDAIDRTYLSEPSVEERLVALRASRGGWKGEAGDAIVAQWQSNSGRG